MSKNSLAGINQIDKSRNELPNNNKPIQKQMGRRSKPRHEKASKPITLKFTESEFDIIENKSGLIPNATYLKNLLLTKTDLLLD